MASTSWSNITVELAQLRGGKVALLVDDRLVVLDEDGSADRHFGRGGSMQILTPEGTALDPAALATDRSGRILLAGSTSRPAPAIGHESGYVTSLAVIRLTAAGRFDRTFGGGDGALETTLGMPPAFSIASDATSASTTVRAAGLAIDRQGRIVLTGTHTTRDGYCRSNPAQWHDSFTLRLTPGGELDSGFGNGGIYSLPTVGAVEGGPVTDSSGGIYFTTGTDSGCEGGVMPVTPYLIHLDSSGLPVPGFGANGWAALNPTPGAYRPGLTLDREGRAFLTSRQMEATPSPGRLGVPSHDLVQRLLPNGSADPGCVFTPRVEPGADVAIEAISSDRANALTMAGTYTAKGDLATMKKAPRAFFLSRASGNCKLDQQFAVDGRAITRFGKGSEVAGRALLIDRKGRIVMAGLMRGPQLRGGVGFALARYLGGR